MTAPLDPLAQVAMLRADVRTELHQVNREVQVERTITRDLVEALHKRVDVLEALALQILSEVRAQKANGHG
jgi:hypothetical protein